MSQYRGVIVSKHSEDIMAVAELLAARVRHRLTYVGRPLPTDIDPTEVYDFIIVGDVRVVREVVERYERADSEPPLIIHVIVADAAENIDEDYSGLGHVNIAPIQQASLDVQDTTLQLDLFEKVLRVLDESVR